MRIADILYSQGFGTRRTCSGLVQHGAVAVGGRVVHSLDEDFATEGLVFSVEGQSWPFHAKMLLMLHKPAGFECSRSPKHHPSVLSLLPPPLRTRGAQPVGRLDQDTTGLLLLTDDGALLHRLSSPKHHVPKVYQVVARHAVGDDQIQQLLDGVVIEGDPRPARAVAVEKTGEQTLDLTLMEGRYHQVKRMMAAVGNRCDALHRSRYGRLPLPPDLAPGHWCWVDPSAL